jgi:hypothetical protein
MSDYIDIRGRYYRFVFYDIITAEGARLTPPSCTFAHFVSRNAIIHDVTIPGAPHVPHSDTVCGLFTEVGRLLFISLLQLFKDLFESRLCLHPRHALTADDLVVLRGDGNVVKFRQGLSYVSSTPDMITHNFAMLADVIDKTVFPRYSSWVGEISDLMDLLRHNGYENMGLIFSHPCLLNVCDKIDAFARAHIYLLTRVKVYNPNHYHDILAELVFRPDWETPVVLNPFLRACYDARKMENRKKVAAAAAAAASSSSSASSSNSMQPAQRGQKNGVALPPTQPLQLGRKPAPNNRGMYSTQTDIARRHPLLS